MASHPPKCTTIVNAIWWPLNVRSAATNVWLWVNHWISLDSVLHLWPRHDPNSYSLAGQFSQSLAKRRCELGLISSGWDQFRIQDFVFNSFCYLIAISYIGFWNRAKLISKKCYHQERDDRVVGIEMFKFILEISSLMMLPCVWTPWTDAHLDLIIRSPRPRHCVVGEVMSQ